VVSTTDTAAPPDRRPASSLWISQPARRPATLGAAQQPRGLSENPASLAGLQRWFLAEMTLLTGTTDNGKSSTILSFSRPAGQPPLFSQNFGDLRSRASSGPFPALRSTAPDERLDPLPLEGRRVDGAGRGPPGARRPVSGARRPGRRPRRRGQLSWRARYSRRRHYSTAPTETPCPCHRPAGPSHGCGCASISGGDSARIGFSGCTTVIVHRRQRHWR